MSRYDCYLESGPRRRKTMVHVLDLLGCVAVGPTTEAALAATPAAIEAFGRVIGRHGETERPTPPIELRVVEHITEGQWLGNGSPYLIFGPDLKPMSDDEITRSLRRHRGLCEELARWAETQADPALDAVPDGGGRTARAILLHVLGAQGVYLSAALAGAPGFSAAHGAVERGELDPATALRRTAEMVAERVEAATPEQRVAVRELSSRSYTLTKAIRRTLEHVWEHLAELSRRPGGPVL